MDYRAYEPSPALRSWVRHFWILEGAGPSTPEHIYPDGCMEIAIHLGDCFSDAAGPQHHSLLIGCTHAPLTLRAGRRTLCLGVKFEPGGAVPFTALPSQESSGRILPLDAAWSNQAGMLRECLAAAPSDTRRVALLEAALEQHRAPIDRRSGDRDVLAIIRRLTAGGVRIDTVAQEAGLSTRQLERRVRQAAGASPKMLARMARFQRALAQSQTERPKWAAIAIANGYFDQAHLIRDFRQFTGTSPTNCDPASPLGAPARRV